MTKHQFDPGDHRLPVEADHLCHDCGKLSDHENHFREREGDQPLPTPGGQPVEPVVMENIRRHAEMIHWSGTQLAQRVQMEFSNRYALGLQRYGMKLASHNGRDPLRDALDELLDAYNYLTQAVMEGQPMRYLQNQVLEMIFGILHGMMSTTATAEGSVSPRPDARILEV